MISQDFLEWEYRRLHFFLTVKEQQLLQDLAAELDDGWTSGRQGSGYFKLDLTALIDDADYTGRTWLSKLASKSFEALNDCHLPDVDSRGLPVWTRRDAWLIYYPDGVGVPRHRDPAPPGMMHVRLNAVAQAPTGGGGLVIYKDPDEYTEMTNSLYIEDGGGVIFSPSEVDHSVDPPTAGRLVFSVGSLIRR